MGLQRIAANRWTALIAATAGLVATTAAIGCGSGGGDKAQLAGLAHFTATRLLAQPNGEVVLLGRTGDLEDKGCEDSDLAEVWLSDAGQTERSSKASVDGCLRTVEGAQAGGKGTIDVLTETYHPSTSLFESNATSTTEVRRVDEDGAIDSAFTPFVDTIGGPSAFAVRSDGSIVASDGRHWLEDGSPDGDFQSSQKSCPPANCPGGTYGQIVYAGSQNSASGIAVQPDDSFAILSEQDLELAGRSVRQVQPRNLILRGFTAAGRNDLRFGTGGRSVAPYAPPQTKFLYNDHDFKQLVATPDRGYIAFGRYATPGGERFVAVKFDSSGRPDRRFGVAGLLTILPQIPADQYPAVEELTVQDDGKLVATAQAGRRHQFTVVARYLADGSPDRGFGNRGVTRLQAGTGVPLNIVELADGKLLGANAADSGPTNVFRFDSGGKLDETFGRAGSVRLGPAGT
jgi:hypothetical protein